jgi:hypothetical protein
VLSIPEWWFFKPLAGIAAAWPGTGFPHLAKIADATHVYYIGRFPQILQFRMVDIPKATGNAVGFG